MADSKQPSRFRRGQPIRADWLNKVGQNILQHVRVVGGGMRRVGTSLVLEMPRQRGGGSGKPLSRAKITDCGVLDESETLVPGLVTVRKISGNLTSPTTDTEDLFAWLPNASSWGGSGPEGAWTVFDKLCLIAPLEGLSISGVGDVEWVIVDILNYDMREAQTGDYDEVTEAPLAPYQLVPALLTCA